ncbi:MAG: DUF6352 family protein [Burkholderiales bacterium]|nr:DUF6352 family protein [Burkholderiales bacterium]
MRDIWPGSGFRELRLDDHGWLAPTDAWLRLLLALPQLDLVEESCAAERRLRAALLAAPSRPVPPLELLALADADARDNYGHFLRFRDGLLAAGTLEAWYLALFRAGGIDLPPLFIDRVTEAIVRNLVDGTEDAILLRAAELLFRPQRIALVDGRVLAADRDRADRLSDPGSLDPLGRLLRQEPGADAAPGLEILNADNAARYFEATERHAFALDLSHTFGTDLGHGLVITLARADSGLKALGRVLERWVRHFLGVGVRIEPRSRVDDPAWRWHIGLDVDATALLNELYLKGGAELADPSRLIGLFQLEFEDPQAMRADLAGKPVYLGLGMSAAQTLKLKPQNLLLDLPLAGPM